MSRGHSSSRAGSRLSRRRILTVAAAVGAGASVAGVAGLSLAGEDAPVESGPLVLSLRDAKTGTFDVFAGESRLTLKDPELAAQLIKAARRG